LIQFLIDFNTFSALRINSFVIDFTQSCVIAAAAVCYCIYKFSTIAYTLLYIIYIKTTLDLVCVIF